MGRGAGQFVWTVCQYSEDAPLTSLFGFTLLNRLLVIPFLRKLHCLDFVHDNGPRSLDSDILLPLPFLLLSPNHPMPHPPEEAVPEYGLLCFLVKTFHVIFGGRIWA